MKNAEALPHLCFLREFAYITNQFFSTVYFLMKYFLPIALFCTVLFSGCVQTIAVSTIGNIVEDGFTGFTEESDLELAAQALPGNLKLLEVMLKSDPENKKMLRLLSEGYASYTLGFVEDESPERARVFYTRARDYGLRILRQDKAFARALDGSIDDLKAELGRRTRDDVPAVFWTAFGWGSYIYLSLSDPNALADLPRAEAMMRFVADKDSSYYYGGAFVFLGTLYGSRSRMLGGDPDLARGYFERALNINKGKFLMTDVYYARSVALQTLDEELFNKLLKTVEETSIEVLPEFRLANAIAKKKAKLLLSKKDELF
jgi:tetratricopeptide (TPR) repeat protein